MKSIKSINSEGMNHLVGPKIACILSLVQNPILHPSLFSLSHSSPFSCSLPPSPHHHFFPLPYPLLSLLVSLAYPFPHSLSSSLTCPPAPRCPPIMVVCLQYPMLVGRNGGHWGCVWERREKEEEKEEEEKELVSGGSLWVDGWERRIDRETDRQKTNEGEDGVGGDSGSFSLQNVRIFYP